MVNYDCGIIVPSSCVPFSGENLTIRSGDTQLKCDASINDVILEFDKDIKILNDANDFSELEPGCFDFDPETITNFELHQLEVAKICEHDQSIEDLQTLNEEFQVGDEIVTINLGCLTPEAASCAIGTNQYQLKALLALFASKLCNHETRISNLE